MKITVFTTCSNPIERQDLFFESIASYRGFADEVLVVDGSKTENDLLAYEGEKQWDRILYHRWPEEFDWPFIGQQFQRGYEASEGDWVIRADLDFVFHEDTFQKIRSVLEKHKRKPAVSFWKYQFTLIDRYNLKSRLVLAINKGLVGDRVKLNGGGDLCQPTLDGNDLTDKAVPEANVPFFNYDFMWKRKATVKKDFARFARSWGAWKGGFPWGGPDDDSSFEHFMKMQRGRFSRPSRKVDLSFHPKFVHRRIKRMTSLDFGHSLWGEIEPATYFKV